MGNCVDSEEGRKEEQPPDWEEHDKIEQFAATCVHECHNELGESVIWCTKKKRLYWLDLEKCEMWSYDPNLEEIRHQKVEMGWCGSCLALRQNGGFVVCSSAGVGLLESVELDETKPPLEPKEICHPIKSEGLNTRVVRLNDGKVDPEGRLVVGAYHTEYKTFCDDLGNLDKDKLTNQKGDPRGGVYRITTHNGYFGMGTYGQYAVLSNLGTVNCSNGMAFGKHEHHNVMYFVDTPTRNVQCFEYGDKPLDKLSDVTTPENFTVGRPDGACVDAQGGYWVADFGGGRVLRIHSNEVTAVVTVDAPQVTCCAFGGPDLDTLYITTATRCDPSPTDRAGGLFQCKIPGIHGYPEPYFAS